MVDTCFKHVLKMKLLKAAVIPVMQNMLVDTHLTLLALMGFGRIHVFWRRRTNEVKKFTQQYEHVTTLFLNIIRSARLKSSPRGSR